ncbi:MAG: alpha/beta hydrolase [Oscillospiraceae bacterium]
MKKALKIVLIAAGVLLAAVVLFITALWFLAGNQSVRKDYYENVEAALPLERLYTAKGPCAVSSRSYDMEDEAARQCRVWYPAELESGGGPYPLVVMVNGTGVPASRYEAVFEHLASWGFVVVGNEDENAWSGASSAASLDLLLRLNGDAASVFYQKIDTEHIGAAGHSQGGVGAINAVTAQANSGLYKAVYTASATHAALAELLGWSYDMSRVSIPCFMTAGTLQADAGSGEDYGIAPLESLQQNCAAVPEGVYRVLARRKDADHGEMLAKADGYMTAWFCWLLRGDETAAGVFTGASPELLQNTDNWQDAAIYPAA